MYSKLQMIGCSVLRRTFPVCKPPLVHGKLFVCTSEKTGTCQAVALKETVAKVNSLTILQARLSRLCRKDEAQGAEGEV